MSSYESRIKTFEDSKVQVFKNRESLFAVTGFVFNNYPGSDNVTCDFCSKSLEGWDINDKPMSEHFLHSKKCFIFNLDTTLNRKKSFDFYKKDAVNSDQLSKFGYFAYAIKESLPEIFCFKCGEMCNTSQPNYLSKCKSHFSTCSKSARNEDFFFKNLLKGKFNTFFDDYLESKDISIDNPDLYFDLLSGPPFLSVKEVILKNKNDLLTEINQKMKNDENRAVNEIQRKK